jgi:hypothetical protein
MGPVSSSARSSDGVVLPEGHTGSSFFHHVLAEAAAAFPEDLAGAELPADTRSFKASYGEALVRFEAHRAASPRRSDIARLLARRTQEQLFYRQGERAVPFLEHLSADRSADALERHAFDAAPGLAVEVPFEGTTYRRREVVELAERLHAAYQMTDAALAAVRWIVELGERNAGRLDLSGHAFAVLGAGAELAPTRALLAAGARVLWVDVAAPSRLLEERDGLAGELAVPAGAGDLLTRPREIAATIAAFGDGEPVHVGMFAYAAGASQEWRLGASMNGIARSLDPALVRSLSLFVSPTTAALVQPEDERGAAERLAAAPLWQSMLHGVGLLPTPGRLRLDGATVSRSVVSIQGLSYQAAQYISKIASAETFAVHGTRFDAAEPRPATVSANVAGITRTRSLSHPVFEAAFIGAPRFGVRIFEPPTTRALAGLLVLHDLLNPDAPGAAGRPFDSAADKAAALFSQQVHGGIYSLPYVLEPAIRASAILGMARRPTVLLKR